jgi:hypothetical protein
LNSIRGRLISARIIFRRKESCILNISPFTPGTQGKIEAIKNEFTEHLKLIFSIVLLSSFTKYIWKQDPFIDKENDEFELISKEKMLNV